MQQILLYLKREKHTNNNVKYKYIKFSKQHFVVGNKNNLAI